MIDVNAPWRIIADLGSPYMQEMMENRGSTIDSLFETAYETTYQEDYEVLQNFMIFSYNRWVANNSYSKTVRVANDGKLIHRGQRRYSTTKEEETKELHNERWIAAYVKIRNIECSSPWPELRVQTVISKASQINQYISLDKALDYVNNELREFNMTAHDFKFNDEPEIDLGTGNIVQTAERRVGENYEATNDISNT